MIQKIIACLVGIVGALLLITTNGYSYGSYGTPVNTACAPATPYVGDCSLCHVANRATSTPAKTAYMAGGTTLTNFFCPAPPPPVCTDNDNDGYAVEGGDCGPIDCNDSELAIYPGAPVIPNNGIDEDCSIFLYLDDVIVLLQIAGGVAPSGTIPLSADVNADGKLGLVEAIYGIQKLASQ